VVFAFVDAMEDFELWATATQANAARAEVWKTAGLATA
jgi:hypothetical protein